MGAQYAQYGALVRRLPKAGCGGFVEGRSRGHKWGVGIAAARGLGRVICGEGKNSSRPRNRGNSPVNIRYIGPIGRGGNSFFERHAKTSRNANMPNRALKSLCYWLIVTDSDCQ
jgi:hypothetical protein